MVINTKKKNKAWVRVWVYWVIREGPSDNVSSDSGSVFQAIGTAGSRALRWERLCILWNREEVKVAGVRRAREMGKSLELEPDHVGSYRPWLRLWISFWVRLKALVGFWIEIWNAQINDLMGSLLCSYKEWSMMATSSIPLSFFIFSHIQNCKLLPFPLTSGLSFTYFLPGFFGLSYTVDLTFYLQTCPTIVDNLPCPHSLSSYP